MPPKKQKLGKQKSTTTLIPLTPFLAEVEVNMPIITGEPDTETFPGIPIPGNTQSSSLFSEESEAAAILLVNRSGTARDLI